MVVILLMDSTANALKLHQHQKFIEDLKEIIAAGPELGAIENKLNHYEAIRPELKETKANVRELLSPIVPLAPR